MLVLHNRVQAYAWGRVDAMTALVGREPSGGHEAELWVGTHPAAPSLVVDDPGGRTLAEVIASDPRRWLGNDLADRGLTALPFLLKVLAIAEPLSLQAHPSAEQAIAGYTREQEAGIALDDPRRNYRDPSPKPEALVAVEPTWALCGFRSSSESAELISALGLSGLAPLVELLRAGGAGATAAGFEWLLDLEADARSHLAMAVADSAGSLMSTHEADPYRWVVTAAGHHRGDPGCLAPLLLNLIRLDPGEAVHLPAGNLHAYLLGAGVEVMAASDNVLRGGLTVKPVDRAELMRILNRQSGLPSAPQKNRPIDGVTTYDCGEEAFSLAVIDAAEPVTISPSAPSLFLATGGAVEIMTSEGSAVLDGGSGAFVPPGGGDLRVSGPGRLWWATVGGALPR